MRLFVALAPPEPVRVALVAWAAGVLEGERGLRPLQPAALHLTLAFLGERPQEDVGALAPALARALGRSVPPREAFADAGLWLAPRRPHVLTAAVTDPTGALSELQAAVTRACVSAIDWEPERRAYRPHVTVARAHRNASVRPAPLPAPAAGRPRALADGRSDRPPALLTRGRRPVHARVVRLNGFRALPAQSRVEPPQDPGLASCFRPTARPQCPQTNR